MRVVIQSFVERFFEKILNFTDYYVYEKHITISETFLFTLLLIRVVWFSVFGVEGSVVDKVFTEWFWVGMFAFGVAAHLIALCLPGLWPRVVVMFGHVFMWSFMAILGVMAHTPAPTAPTFFASAILAAFITVRLYNEIGVVHESTPDFEISIASIEAKMAEIEASHSEDATKAMHGFLTAKENAATTKTDTDA